MESAFKDSPSGASARAQAPESSGGMNRREALRRIGVLLGGAVSASSVAGLMSGCQADASTDWTPHVFSSEQNERVIAITERILPATDTPGAKAAQVNRFIDQMLAEWHPPAFRRRLLTGIDEVERHAQQRFGASFTECAPEEQDRLLASFERAAEQERFAPFAPRDSTGAVVAAEDEATQRATREGSGRGREEADENLVEDSLSAAADSTVGPSSAPPREAEEPPPFFHIMKEQTLLGYYTSEIGMTEELQWEAVPGRYEGCVPLSEVGRAWA